MKLSRLSGPAEAPAAMRCWRPRTAAGDALASVRAGGGAPASLKDVDPEPMPLVIGTRLGPYEIVAALGAGGSACGHAARAATHRRRRRISVSSRWGWGPSALEGCRS